MRRYCLGLVLIPLVIGCGDARDVTEVTVQTIAVPDSATYRLLEKVIEEFEAENGDVRVRLVGSRRPLEYVFRGVVARADVDIIEVKAGEIAVLAERGALALLPQLRETVEASHSRTAAQATGPEGVHAVPWSARPKLLMYNRQKLGEPGPPGDWEEMLALAERLTRDTEGDGRPDQFGFALAGQDSADFGRHYTTFLAQLGVPVMELSAGQWWFNVAPREGTQVMEFIVGLRNASPPESIVSDDRDAVKQFRDGRTAMVIAGPEGLYLPPDGPDFEVGAAALPAPAAGVSVCDVEFRHLVVPGYVRGRRKDAAVRFLEFISGPQGQRIVARGLEAKRPVVAVRSDVLADEPYRSDPELRAFVRALDRAAPVLPAYIWEGKGARDWIGALHDILRRDEPSTGVVRDLVYLSQQRGNEALACRYTEIGHPSATTALGMMVLGVLVFVAVAYVVARR